MSDLERGDFLADYQLYTSKQESPQCFHFWSGISIIAAVVGRNIWIDRGYYPLFTNHYTTLVSASALCRKTTAIEIALSILQEAQAMLREEGLGGDQTTIISGKITPEAFFRAMSSRGLDTLHGEEEPEIDKNDNKSRPLMLVSAELGMLLSNASIANGLIDIVTDIYTCPSYREYPTKTAGLDIVHDAFVNFISATTPSWIAENITKGVFNQGFAGRNIFVYSNTPHCLNMWPDLSRTELEARQRLVAFVRDRGLLLGQMKVTEGAEQLTEDWYNSRKEKLDDDRLAGGFFGREHEHLLKLAMVLAIIRSRELLLRKCDILLAMKHLNAAKSDMPGAFKDVAFQDEVREVRIVENLLKEFKELTRRELVQKVYYRMDADTLDKSIGELIKADKVTSAKVRRGKAGPKTMVYTLKE